MLFQPYDYETDKRVYGEECYESGFEEGTKQEHFSTLNCIKELVKLGFELQDLKNAFRLNDEEVKFVLSE